MKQLLVAPAVLAALTMLLSRPVGVHALPQHRYAFSATLTIDGLVDRPRTFTRDELVAAVGVATGHVSYTYLDADGNQQTEDYVGAALFPLLRAAGPQVDPAHPDDLLRRYYVQATDADGTVDFVSWGEIDSSATPNVVGPTVAVEHNGAPLTGDTGMAALIFSADPRAKRNLSSLARLTVMALPAPATADTLANAGLR